MAAHASGLTLREAALGSPAIMAHFSAAEIESLLDYDGAVGQCRAMVDRVLAQGQLSAP
jgi:hypothetical protein